MTAIDNIKGRLSQFNLQMDLMLKGGKNVFTVTNPESGQNWRFYSLLELEAFENGFNFAMTQTTH